MPRVIYLRSVAAIWLTLPLPHLVPVTPRPVSHDNQR